VISLVIRCAPGLQRLRRMSFEAKRGLCDMVRISRAVDGARPKIWNGHRNPPRERRKLRACELMGKVKRKPRTLQDNDRAFVDY